jgi:ABC-2 type transport system permease protein
MPPWLFHASQYLPYFYQMYFPAAIFTGRILTPAAALQGLAIQSVWALLLLGVAQCLWLRGLRRYTAVGG